MSPGFVWGRSQGPEVGHEPERDQQCDLLGVVTITNNQWQTSLWVHHVCGCYLRNQKSKKFGAHWLQLLWLHLALEPSPWDDPGENPQNDGSLVETSLWFGSSISWCSASWTRVDNWLHPFAWTEFTEVFIDSNGLLWPFPKHLILCCSMISTDQYFICQFWGHWSIE